MKKLFCMILAAAMVLAAGCSSGSEPASSAAPASGPALEPASSEEASEAAAGEPVELMVSAAASLTDCLTEMKALYEAENEGVTLTDVYKRQAYSVCCRKNMQGSGWLTTPGSW